MIDLTRDMHWRQEEHDRLFHWDIFSLSKHDRLKHLTLHLAKYQGKYLASQAAADDGKKFGTVVDALIVLLSMANVIGYKIKNSAEPSVGFSYDSIIIETSNLCKVIEALDHMESLDFRQEIQKAIEKLVYLWQVVPTDRAVTWNDMLARLEFIESKYFMYDHVIENYPHLKPISG